MDLNDIITLSVTILNSVFVAILSIQEVGEKNLQRLQAKKRRGISRKLSLTKSFKSILAE